MTEDIFPRAMHDCVRSPGAFHHRDHLHVTWLLVRRQGLQAARGTIADGLRALSARHGQPDRYHETITRFWVDLLGYLIAARPDVADFDTFVETFPHLLDAGLPYRHWQRQTLDGAAARAAWRAPDLLPLPW